jgi:hypothetical protein
MGRNRRQEMSDPMDLLLDTVSNVFGGVMFLTLLAALLVISRGGKALDSRSPSSPQEDIPLVDPLLAIESLELQLNEIDFVLESQAKALSMMVPGENIETKISDLDRLQRESKIVVKQLADAKNEIESETLVKTGTESSQDEMRKQFEALKTQVQDKRDTLAKIEEKSSRNITFSMLRNASTSEVVIMLRYGRIYRCHINPGSDDINLEDIERTFLGAVLPKPSGGSVVTANVLKDIVARTIQSFPPDRYHVTIAVWDDSFSNFNALRNELVASGYQYRTIPCTNDSFLKMSGGDSLVQ